MIIPKHLLQRHLYLLSSKRAIQKSAGARSDLIDNERIVKLQRIYRREIERLCKDFQTGERTFSTADAKLYVPVVTLSTQDNFYKGSQHVLKEQLPGTNINLK